VEPTSSQAYNPTPFNSAKSQSAGHQEEEVEEEEEEEEEGHGMI